MSSYAGNLWNVTVLPFLYFVKVVFEHPNAEQEVTILAFLLLHELMAVDVVSSIVISRWQMFT